MRPSSSKEPLLSFWKVFHSLYDFFFCELRAERALHPRESIVCLIVFFHVVRNSSHTLKASACAFAIASC